MEGIIGSLKEVQKAGQDLFSTILVEVYSFDSLYLRINEIVCSWWTNFSFYCLFSSCLFLKSSSILSIQSAVLAIVIPSVWSDRLSVRRWYCVNTSQATITLTSLEVIPWIVSLWLTSPRNSEGNVGQGYYWGLMGIHMRFRLVPKSSTLDDLNCRKMHLLKPTTKCEYIGLQAHSISGKTTTLRRGGRRSSRRRR